MPDKPRTSIIIAVAKDNPYLRECLEHCQQLTDQDFELLVMTDEDCELPFPKTRVMATGKVGPSVKRDLGIKESKGSIIAFLDDDTYPAPQWLAAAVQALVPHDVSAVGGPAVTPPHDGLLEKASGYVYASWLCGGPYVYRYVPRAPRDVDDYPTCNLIMKKEDLMEVGGFDTCYWPGEDTVICLKITKELKKRIVYRPEVMVYHHRRKLFKGHMKQVLSYARHRGYFVKKFPQTSLRLGYFLPTLLLAGVALGWLPALGWPVWWLLWGGGIGLYLAAALLSGLNARPFYLAPLVSLGIMVTQLSYGFYFVKGLTAKVLYTKK